MNWWLTFVSWRFLGALSVFLSPCGFFIVSKKNNRSAGLFSEGRVGVDDDVEHFVEAVGYSIAVCFADLLGGEVGGDEGEELVVVSVFEQVDDWRGDVAVVENFFRLAPHILDAEHWSVFELLAGTRVAEVVFGVFGVDDGDGIGLVGGQDGLLAEVVDGVLKGEQGGCFSVARRAAEHYAEFVVLGGEIASQLLEVGFCLAVFGVFPPSGCNFGLVGGRE